MRIFSTNHSSGSGTVMPIKIIRAAAALDRPRRVGGAPAVPKR